MKLIALLVLTTLAACSNTRHLAIEPADAANVNGACSAGPGDAGACGSGPCSAEVRCLPDGNCEVKCTGPAGQSCEVVVLPVEDDC